MIENHEFGGTSGDGSEFKPFHVWTPNGKTMLEHKLDLWGTNPIIAVVQRKT